MQIMNYTPAMQAVGAFDGGKITEQKPIGFPGEGSVVKRVGPLFYWAWAFAKEEGFIGLHPHEAFEIMTYVIQGKAEHGDTLGTRSTVGPGGVQMMHTGSGVSHQERFIGPDMEAFQIWFEPFINDAVKRPPSYSQFEHDEFPVREDEGYRLKTVIGEGSPVNVTVDAKMWDLEVNAGKSYTHNVKSDYSLAVLVVRGDGSWTIPGDHRTGQFHEKDFLVGKAEKDTSIVIQSGEDQNLRLVMIEVPTKVDYPLYPKR